MQDETAAFVHTVIRNGIGLKNRLARGEALSLATEQAALERLLSRESDASRYADLSTELEIRYALVCWLDEIFVLDPVWGPEWNEHKLEGTMFETNDRAWKFWEKARRAAARSATDVLEVYYLCVMLGFRGELLDAPEKLRSWSEVTRAQIERSEGENWVSPPELDSPSKVPPLHGLERLQRMVVRGAVLMLVLIPLAAFFVVLQFGR
jgi:type VI secretion system protein ImpK